MKYAIIENEEFASINLREVIKSVRPDYECVFMAETVEECVEYFSMDHDTRLIFMDIELDDCNCFEIFRRTEIKVPVIFTTAYDKYAIDAFKVNSIDYLLKPVSEEDVERALRKFESMHLSLPRNYKDVGDSITKARTRSRILISYGAGYSFVSTDEIAWFEAEDKYISVILLDGRRMLTDFASLTDVMEVLDPDRFFQISRKVVASIESIGKISKYFKGRLQVGLVGSGESRTEIVSAARRTEFLGWLGHTTRK